MRQPLPAGLAPRPGWFGFRPSRAGRHPVKPSILLRSVMLLRMPILTPKSCQDMGISHFAPYAVKVARTVQGREKGLIPGTPE